MTTALWTLFGFLAGSIVAGFVSRALNGAIVRDLQEIVADKKASIERLLAVADSHLKDKQEWRRVAVQQSARVHDLTDRLLKLGKMPALPEDDGMEPLTVGAADQQAVDEARREQERSERQREIDRRRSVATLEPVAVSDDEVPPVARMTADESYLEDDFAEDTSFRHRMGQDG